MIARPVYRLIPCSNRSGVRPLPVILLAIALIVPLLAGCGRHSSRPQQPATSTTSYPIWPGIFDHGDRSRPLVALTFDSNMTEAMLGELDQHKVASFDNARVIDELIALHVPATFFLSGLWIERYPDETRRLAKTPDFEVGSHSYKHKAFTGKCYGLATLRQDEMANDVRQSENLLRQYTDHPTPYFRFPGLCHDDTSVRIVASTGVTIVGADLASGDAFNSDATLVVKNTLDHVHNGSVIVMHITGGNTAPRTADALPQIVVGLRQRGFQLVKVSDLISASTPVASQ